MKARLSRVCNSVSFGCFLHLLFPGLGYFLWKDYLFGLFVFLIALIAMALALLSLFVSLPLVAKMLLFGLPILFYIVSFFDLARSIRKKRGKISPSGRIPLILLTIGVGFQFLVPLAPASFLIRNHPDLFRAAGNDFSPFFRRGELLSANRLAYTADLGLEKFGSVGRIMHSLPQRCDIMRYVGPYGNKRLGLVIGLPGEEIELAQGVLSVDGWPTDICSEVQIVGDWPLTQVDDSSILVADLRLGGIREVTPVHPRDIIGRVSPIFDD